MSDYSLIIQAVRDGKETSLFVSDAKLSSYDGGYKISFFETDERDKKHKTEFFVSADNAVTICAHPSGFVSTFGNIELRSGVRQQIHNPDGTPVTVGVMTNAVRSTLDKSGGDVEVDYTLDVNSAYAVSNSFKISVCRNKQFRTCKRTERTNTNI